MKFPDVIPPEGNPNEKQIRIAEAETRDWSNTLPILDLHGARAEDAAREIEDFIIDQFSRGESCCRIGHGKGRGILAKITKEKIAGFVKEGKIESSFSSRLFPGGATVIVFTPEE
jgi:DNA-nicking Smr family endonuclease